MRFPIIYQRGKTDCGPTALAMIAAWHGCRVSVGRLSHLAGTSSSGTTLAGLMAAAENIGYATKGVRLEADALAETPLPLIAHWRERKRDHYVVLYKMDQRLASIADPARGRMKLSLDRFHKCWTGVVLILSGSPKIPAAAITQSAWSRLYNVFYPVRHLLLDVVMAAVLITILGLSSSLFIQDLIDFVLVSGRKPTLEWLGLGLLVVLLARSGLL